MPGAESGGAPEIAAGTTVVVGGSDVQAGEIVEILIERGREPGQIRLVAGEDRAGETEEIAGHRFRVAPARPGCCEGAEAVIFCDDGDLAHVYLTDALASGAVVVDASPLSRHDPEAALIVAEVNPQAVREQAVRLVLASPTPAAVGVAVALAPLRALARIESVVMTVLESASRRGREAIETLSRQTIALLQGRGEGEESDDDVDEDAGPSDLDPPLQGDEREPEDHDAADARRAGRDEDPDAGTARLAFNARPQLAAGRAARPGWEAWGADEAALTRELARVLGDPAPRIVASVVRVPVFFGCAVTVVVDLAEPIPEEALLRALREGAGLFLAGVLGDDDEAPGPLDVAGSSAVHVARLRVDPADPRRVAFWVVFDDLRRGTAFNAVSLVDLALRARAAGASPTRLPS